MSSCYGLLKYIFTDCGSQKAFCNMHEKDTVDGVIGVKTSCGFVLQLEYLQLFCLIETIKLSLGRPKLFKIFSPEKHILSLCHNNSNRHGSLINFFVFAKSEKDVSRTVKQCINNWYMRFVQSEIIICINVH